MGADEPWQIDRRMERLNDLGFDVQELALVRSADGQRLRIRPTLVEEGHHSRTLAGRTGLRVQENQARRLLNDIAAYGAWLEHEEGASIPEAVMDYRWLREIYQPAIDRVPPEPAPGASPPSCSSEMLRHRDRRRRRPAERRQRGGDGLLRRVRAPRPPRRAPAARRGGRGLGTAAATPRRPARHRSPSGA